MALGYLHPNLPPPWGLEWKGAPLQSEDVVIKMVDESNGIGDAGLEALSAHVKAGTARLNFMPARWTVPGPVVPAMRSSSR
mgnify:CR=1 FL=1